MGELGADTRVRPGRDVLMTKVDESSAVLLDPHTKVYFTLNESGIFLWEELVESGESTAAVLSGALCGAFEVSPDRAEADVLSFLRELESQGLVSR